MAHLYSYFPITDPTLIFFVVLLIILLAPIIMGKLRIPHIIGMVLAGVAVGKYGFNILTRDASFELFGRVGLYYIMFLASLEMDMEGLRRNKWRTLIFGLLTFAIPFVLSYFMGMTSSQLHSDSRLVVGVYHGFQYPRVLSHRGALWPATEAECDAERGFDDDQLVAGPHRAGYDRGLRRWSCECVVLAVVHRQGHGLCGADDHCRATGIPLLPSPVQ